MNNIQISCLYFNENEYYGYYVCDKNKPVYEWECECFGEHYSEFVVDMLNHDYYVATDASDLIDFDLIEEIAQEESGPHEEHFFRTISQIMHDHSYLIDTPGAFNKKEYMRRVNIIKRDMDSINFNAIKHLIDKVFIEKNLDNLSALQKYYAYVHSYNKQKLLKFVSNASFGVELNNIGVDNDRQPQPQKILLSLQEKRKKQLKISGDEIYTEVCKAFSANNAKCHSEKFYEFNNFGDMFLFLLCEMINLNCTLKICPNCGRYFHPERSDAVYCNRQSPQDNRKTCQEYVKYQKYINKTRNDEATKLYKQIYNQKANKVRRMRNDSKNNKSNLPLEKDLNNFKLHAERWKKEVKAGTRTEAEYIAWLKEVKEKKVL